MRIDRSVGGAASCGHIQLGIAEAGCHLDEALASERNADWAYALCDGALSGAVGGVRMKMEGGDGALSGAVGGVRMKMGTGTVVGLLLDLEANELSVYRNQVFQGVTRIAHGCYWAAVCVGLEHGNSVTVLRGVQWPCAGCRSRLVLGARGQLVPGSCHHRGRACIQAQGSRGAPVLGGGWAAAVVVSVAVAPLPDTCSAAATMTAAFRPVRPTEKEREAACAHPSAGCLTTRSPRRRLEPAPRQQLQRQRRRLRPRT